jgi:putative endonuclease
VINKILAWLAWRGKKAVGARGEAAAWMYLQRRGYKLLDQNVKTPVGEADLVLQAPDGAMVLVEVKARIVDPNNKKPAPEEQVDKKKKAKLQKIMAHLVKANGWRDKRKRIDVVAVEFASREDVAPLAVRHHPNAVGG